MSRRTYSASLGCQSLIGDSILSGAQIPRKVKASPTTCCQLTYVPLAKFLFSLGLQRYPSLPVVLELASSQDETVREAALRYFLDNVLVKYPDYDPNNFGQIAFIPSVKDQKPYMAKPSEVSSSPLPTTGAGVT